MTLGHAAAKIGIQKTLTVSEENAENKVKAYQKNYFDQIVRDDLCHLDVDGRLENRTYPFPNKVSILNISEIQIDYQELTQDFNFHKLIVFMKRHPWLTGVAALLLSVPFGLSDVGSILGLSVFVILIRMILARPKKYQKVLVEDAKQYWKIREYLRNALIVGELTPQEGVKKLLNARLVQRFPDTIEEIEAHAFNYRHGIIE
ncbi:TPA: hypothetical protein ACGOSV_000167 [Streptococcus suis]|uniref:hypothetical protein n=1 Tax=Streptococcus suis TaxID=1307 RepID=UPI000CF6E420|nr:hypothetical protein [Streptococcus suis]NQK44981.1 hypothetical protein [Streptococcus suis]NQN53303.1 hypothetical protein [Streptococcus suis]NRG98187.1 hypothetical protein [Streptococcus suis]HEM5983632.1 hypothetical protein [Streptococcus suis]HEM5988803.1 hypothetical protein [Streptococcus suis]